MPFTLEEVGGIAIPYPSVDERTVQRELEKLDRGLFLDKEWEPNGPHGGYVYYLVKHRVGENLILPVAGTEWRDANGPKPLNLAIVERVKRNEGALEGVSEWARQIRDRKLARQQAEQAEQADEIIRQFDNAGRSGGNFGGPVHRSQGLRLARDRVRRGRPS